MNIFSRKRLIPILLIPVLLYNCDYRREIFDESSVWVKVNIDWSEAKISPNGATICFYPHRTDINPVILRTNSQVDSVRLYKSDYSVIVFNETTTDHDYISFRGTDQYETFEAYAKSIVVAGKYSKVVTEKVASAPDVLAASSIDLFQVTRDMIQTNTHKTLFFKPKRLMDLLTVKANIKGMNNALSTGNAISISGLAEGVFLATGIATSNPVTHFSIFNNKIFNSGSFTDGSISTTINTFGVTSKTDILTENFVTFYFKLRDGTDYQPIIRNVTELVRIDGPNRQIYIEIDNLELPNVPDVNPGSGFKVDISGWGENITIETPVVK